MKNDLARIRHLSLEIRRLSAELERHASAAPVLEERDHFLDELQSLAEKYLDLYDKAPDLFVSVDPATGVILQCNETLSAAVGYAREEIVGRPIFEMYHPDCMDAVRMVFHEFQTTGKVDFVELQLRRKDGSKLEVSLKASSVQDSDGRVLFSRSIWRDITERKRAEKEILKLNEELEQRVRDRTAQLLAANESLQEQIHLRERAEQERRKLEAQFQHAQKLESLGILAGGIAHHFNNMLTSILGYSDLARSALPADSTPRSFIDEVIKGARRAAELTRQMLAYSGKGRFVVRPLCLSVLVEDMSRLLEISISKKCVLQYHFMPNLPTCEADTAQMRQIIMNLIINASEAIGDRSGVIAVGTGVMYCDRPYLSESYLDDNLPEGLYVYVEVSDTGCSISEETKAKLFDPFFTTKFTGRGLGLAAVLGIVRGHRGAIKVYSELGKGTNFKVLFPATTGPAHTETAPIKGPSAWRGSGIVLIVDDEESVRGLARRMMEMMGFTVLTAADWREGVEVFRREHEQIRLVLLDMTMPHLDGEQAFREMRRIRTGIPTVLCSGYNEQTATNRFADKGVAAFIQKPFQYQQLVAVVRQALGEATEPNQPLQQTGPA